MSRRRTLIVGVAVILLGLGALPTPHAGAQVTSAVKPFFYGKARIEGRPADDGTFVDVAVVRSADDYTICGLSKVSQTPLFESKEVQGPGSFIVPIEMTPDGLNPDTVYTFYVNMVYAGTAGNPGFSRLGGSARHDVHVSIAALKNNAMPNPSGGASIPVVYWYGAVRMRDGAAPKGTMVEVRSVDGACRGQTTTDDLYWEPKGAPDQIYGVRGFYQVAILGPGSCTGRTVRYNFYVDGVLAGDGTRLTPPYGTSARMDLYRTP